MPSRYLWCLQILLLLHFFRYMVLSMFFPGCKALCLVFNFIVLLSICLISSLVHFKNYPESTTRSTASLFIPSMRFLLSTLVLRSFLVCLRFSFLIDLSSSAKYLWFSFSPSHRIFSFFQQFYFIHYWSFPTFYYQHGTFSMLNSIPLSWVYIFVLWRISNCFSLNFLKTARYCLFP